MFVGLTHLLALRARIEDGGEEANLFSLAAFLTISRLKSLDIP